MESARLLPAEYFLLSYGEIPMNQITQVGIFQFPARVFLAQNFTDVFLVGLMDGQTDNIMLPPGGFVLIDCGTNKGTPNTASIPQGYGLWVNPLEEAPSKGFVVLSYWYAG